VCVCAKGGGKGGGGVKRQEMFTAHHNPMSRLENHETVHQLHPFHVETSRISRQSEHEGGKVVSHTHRPSLPSKGKIPGTGLCQRLSRPQNPNAAGVIEPIKNSNNPI
jgi:hypothetical protein